MMLLKSMKKGTDLIKFESIHYLCMYNKAGIIYQNYLKFYLIKYFIARKHIYKV